MLVTVCTMPSLAQPLPVSLPTEGVQSIARKYQIKRVGSLDVAPIFFNGQRLFDISAPVNRDPNAFPPVAARVDVIQDNLQEVVPPAASFTDLFQRAPARYDPATFAVKVAEHNGYLTLVATDQNGTRETSLLTLTDQDAKYNGVPVHVLARQWADTLESVLGDALRAREPGARGRQVRTGLLTIVAAIFLTLLVWALRAWLRRQRALTEQRLERADAREAELEDGETAPSVMALRAWRSTLVTIEWLLAWTVVIAWVLAVLLVLFTFPQTQALARRLWSRTVSIAVIWLVAGAASRFGSFLVIRFARTWERRPFRNLDEAGRRHLRMPTIVRSLDYGKTMLVYSIAVALTVGAMGASTSAVVTLGAALAFAVSFGAQSLVKDLVNGFFILMEDQYAMGDYVSIGLVTGVIETVTLRITQLRSDDGRLVTIPNSQVAVVENWTRGWSRVDYRLAVAIDADVPRALEVFEEVLCEFARDPQWRRLLTEAPKVLGVESMSSLGVILRAWVQTVPGKMFEVTRELNRRMHAGMVQANIQLGMPVSRVLPKEPVASAQPPAPAPAQSAGPPAE
jgi:moderate conductance mechanosensitive channel